VVEYEHFRIELIRILHILADMEYQQEIWSFGRPPESGEEDFDIAMHFLLDDSALGDDPSEEIGLVLKDGNEAEAVGKVTRPILELFKEIGGTREPYQYINHPRWLAVVEAAQKALEVIK
jgi:hypothetical protein